MIKADFLFIKNYFEKCETYCIFVTYKVINDIKMLWQV